MTGQAMGSSMPEISRSETLRDNERIKHGAGALTAWGNALLIGGFGKAIVDQKLDLRLILGILLGSVMLCMASMILTMLVAEGEI